LSIVRTFRALNVAGRPGLEIRVSRDPKFEKNRKNAVFMHILFLKTLF